MTTHRGDVTPNGTPKGTKRPRSARATRAAASMTPPATPASTSPATRSSVPTAGAAAATRGSTVAATGETLIFSRHQRLQNQLRAAKQDGSIASMHVDELRAIADGLNLDITGTGANGAVLKSDLLDALGHETRSESTATSTTTSTSGEA